MNFLEISSMYNLLKRKSMRASEVTIYKIVKAYVDAIASEKRQAIIKSFIKTINFESMS